MARSKAAPAKGQKKLLTSFFNSSQSSQPPHSTVKSPRVKAASKVVIDIDDGDQEMVADEEVVNTTDDSDQEPPRSPLRISNRDRSTAKSTVKASKPSKAIPSSPEKENVLLPDDDEDIGVPVKTNGKVKKTRQSSSKKQEGDNSDEEDEEVPVKAKSKGKKAKKSASKKQEDYDSDDDEASGRSGATNKGSPELSNDPPISKIPAIFADLVKRTPSFLEVAKVLEGRKLRVATMCSGTESPLLALELIADSVRDLHGVKMEIEHVFSCEIEPFKQAYIERNFRPPLLFRDVCELGDDFATTAYGALAAVPGDVDLLVAGTSCVDYSNLNNEKQDIDAEGESGKTFRGMMQWVKNHRPPVVILENVCGAPWKRVVAYFQKEGYSAQFTRVDTKQYYVPHTRTRVYLLAVDEKHSLKPDRWKEMLEKMRRPASVTLDAFLLPADDPRVHLAREKMVQEGAGGGDKRIRVIDWGRCESRHQRARLEEALGTRRPLTNWDEGGQCHMPQGSWGDWALGQVERVWDLMDITTLRSAKKGVDPAYKVQIWNLSQNVDRAIGSNRVGICPCVTPTMIPYLTNRGGPLVGLEALGLQGLPVDKLLLTRESEDQLSDLAGNAMSTTVVGATIMAALIVSRRLIESSSDRETGSTSMVVDSCVDERDNHITGENQLAEQPLSLCASTEVELRALLQEATNSARLCECEGRIGLTHREISKCKDCDSTACSKCQGRPEHNYKSMTFEEVARTQPLEFSDSLKAVLPMCLSFSDVTGDLLEGLKKSVGEISQDKWSIWKRSVLRAVEHELFFAGLKRQTVWSASYASSTANLTLTLHPHHAEWYLFAKPNDDEPANSKTRELLSSPVARLICTFSLFEGTWELALPAVNHVEISVQGQGSPTPSWEAKLGLQEPEFRDKKVCSEIKIIVPEESKKLFDQSIDGTYVLLDKCGTANNGLHKSTTREGTGGLPLFLFLDPTRCGNSDDDAFVISTNREKLSYGETRPLLAQLSPKWRQSSSVETRQISCTIPQQWIPAADIACEPSNAENAAYASPHSKLTVDISQDACSSANALLVCKIPMTSNAGSEWKRNNWNEVDILNERITYQSIAWLTERVRTSSAITDEWISTPVPGEQENCERCAPTAPRVRWYHNGRKVVGLEDPVQAGFYERALKDRPKPFVTQLKLDEAAGIATLRIGLNVSSLMHRALSRLPTKHRLELPALAWQFKADYLPIARLKLDKYALTSNRRDKEHSQPPHFVTKLRPEQLRSLSWMIDQESPECKPFLEEEIAEAILEPMNWRAQARAQRPVQMRGGVLADEVGYGKTAITLGLIDCTMERAETERPPKELKKGRIPVRGTLVIVPPHLTKQWASEAKKFAKNHFDVIVLSTASSLNSLTIAQVQEADIVIVASNLFKSQVYLDNLSELAACAPLPNNDGRHFSDKLDSVTAALGDQVDLLKSEGADAVWKSVETVSREEIEPDFKTPTKRLKGKQYREAVSRALSASFEAGPSYRGGSHSGTSTRASSESMDVQTETEAGTGNSRNSSLSTSTSRPKKIYRQVEVVIPPYIPKSKKQSGPSKAVDSQPSRRRTANRKRTIESDDEEENASGSDYKAPSSAESDDDFAGSDDGAISSEPESDMDVDDESGSDRPKPRKGVGKQKAAVKPKKPAKQAAPKNSAKKRKSDAMEKSEDSNGPEEPAAKKAKVEKPRKLRRSGDPWKLKSKGVRNNWKKMQAPPLEMFHFHRIVIDEYTYLQKKVHTMITHLSATCRWVLSGTPPIHDFAAVKTIAVFLGLHLGVDDDAEGSVEQIRKRARDRTATEKFHSFREVRSLDWHAHRHTIGQRFLDQFVRQNIAEIDEIPSKIIPQPIQLPAAERAIYLELDHHLKNLDMMIKRGKKGESDREKRLAKSLGDSGTAEEALLKRCSHFDLDIIEEENAMRACDVIVRDRQKQLQECQAELTEKVTVALEKEDEIGPVNELSLFREFVRNARDGELGDKEASEVVRNLLIETGALDEDASDSAKKKYSKGKGRRDDDDIPESVREKMWQHREQTHEIRKVAKELVARMRSLRYFKIVRDVQRVDGAPDSFHCPACGQDDLPIDEVAVMSSCGHIGCEECVRRKAAEEECVYAEDGTCRAAARLINIVKASTLGVDDVRDGQGKHYGRKLEEMLSLIKDDLPNDERVLIFVQFPDLMQKVADALDDKGIKFLQIKGNASQKSKNLDAFQNNSKERVLLLNVMDESASGANLTCANHGIFLSPLLATTQQEYDACETQAIGRLRRYGQGETVHIYRYFSEDTIDTEIYQTRRPDYRTADM